MMAVFVGATLTATSTAIAAAVLLDLGLMRGPVAQTIMGAAGVDDILGLVVLSLVVGAPFPVALEPKITWRCPLSHSLENLGRRGRHDRQEQHRRHASHQRQRRQRPADGRPAVPPGRPRLHRPGLRHVERHHALDRRERRVELVVVVADPRLRAGPRAGQVLLDGLVH